MAGRLVANRTSYSPEGAPLTAVHERGHADWAISDLPGHWRVDAQTRYLLRALAEGVQRVEDFVWGVVEGTRLDVAEGAALERWGKLVDEPRGSLISDTEYRAVIKGKVLANFCDGSPDELMRVIETAAAPVVCMEYFDLPPAGFQIQVARESWMGEAYRRRVRRVLAHATPAGRNAIWVEALHGGFGPAPSCVGNTFTGPLSRVI